MVKFFVKGKFDTGDFLVLVVLILLVSGGGYFLLFSDGFRVNVEVGDCVLVKSDVFCEEGIYSSVSVGNNVQGQTGVNTIKLKGETGKFDCSIMSFSKHIVKVDDSFCSQEICPVKFVDPPEPCDFGFTCTKLNSGQYACLQPV